MSQSPDPVVLNGLCIITRRALKPQATIRRMIREPACAPEDSGWRFLTGEETEAELEEPRRFAVRPLEKIVAADPSISPHLDAPVRRAFSRAGRGEKFTEHFIGKPLSQKIMGGVMMTLLIAGIVYSVAGPIFYWPPYSWLADFQVWLVGGHLPFFTFLASMFVLIVFVCGLTLPWMSLLSAFAAQRGEPWILELPHFPEALLPGRDDLPGDDLAMRLVQRFNRYAPALVAMVVGFGFGGYTLFLYATAPTAKEPTNAAAVDLSRNGLPEQRYVRLSAEPDWERELKQGAGPGIDHFYVPLQPHDPRRQPRYAVVMKFSKYDRDELAEAKEFEGIISRNALPGEVVGRFRNQGLEPREGNLVLEYDVTPAKAAGNAVIGLVIGGSLIVIGVGMAMVQWWKEQGEQ
jgi:hypothetical protein